MNKHRSYFAASLALAIMLSGCSLFGCGTETPGIPSGNGTAVSAEVTAEPREITGDEALELYGVTDNEPVDGPTSTPLYFFPAQAWVLESVNPLDPDENISILPMFTRPTLSEDGTWMGDLEAGIEVVLQSVNPEGTSCLVEGVTVQGWTTEGWVACNRLSFNEP